MAKHDNCLGSYQHIFEFGFKKFFIWVLGLSFLLLNHGTDQKHESPALYNLFKRYIYIFNMLAPKCIHATLFPNLVCAAM